MVKKAAEAQPNSLLRAARKERGWTQQYVADQIGAPLALNVTRWERGTAVPSAYYVERLCTLFGKTPLELGLLQVDASISTDQQDPARSQTYHQMWMLPYPRNLFFLGREDVLAQLQRQLQASQTTALSQPQAINGLGGVGKTQVALEYVYRHTQDYQAIFWTRADSRDALVAGFLEIANTVKLPERDERDQTVIVAAVKGWLSQNPSWLLILDNADELSILPEFLPSPIQGHILLTTRAQALGRLANRIEVDTLDQDTATLLLLRRAGLLALDAPLAQAKQIDRQAATQIAQELGGLPLALDQAGAYLEETQCSLQQYLALYRSHRADLLHHRGGLVQDHPDSVATTWSLSFALVEQRNTLAADLLRLCALLHPDAIPEEIFLQGAALLGPALSTIEADPLAFNKALAVIQSYSLLRRTGHEQTLSIHRLVQAVLQDTMTQQERDLWTERTMAALDAVFPEVRHQIWGQWEQCGRLLPHVLRSAAFTTTQKHSLELASLLTKTADYLRQRAQNKQAEPLYRQALHIREQIQGNEHPQVAFPLNGLADIYREQGLYKLAEPLYQRALHIWEQTPDPDHFEITSLLNGLAILYLEQGQFQPAEPLLKRALLLNEQAPDSQHAKIAPALNNLATLYLQQGQFELAEPLLKRALLLDEQMFGPQHPEVAYSLTNLADLYLEQGQLELAEPHYQRALHIREQTLGYEHPQVAFPLNGLATLYRNQGHFELAEPLYQRAFTIRHQQRGAQHPETAESLHDLARSHELQGQSEQALTLYQQALAIREHSLGPEHPHTIDTRTHYVHLLRACGRSEEASALE